MPGSMGRSDLSGKQQDRLLGLMMSLKEFAFGLDQSGLAAVSSQEGSAIQRFFSNALYQYCSNFFLVSGSHRLRDFLDEIDCSDLLGPIDSTLDSTVGKTTLREVLRVFRNKFLVHTIYVIDPVEDELRGRIDLAEPLLQEQMGILVFDLFARTRDLFENLGSRFPQPWEES